MSQRLSDRVAGVIDPIVAAYGEQFSWEYTPQLMPGPKGLAMVGVFVLTMKNPLLGTGDMAAVDPIPDFTSVLDPEFVKTLVANQVTQLRELHAKNLQMPARP